MLTKSRLHNAEKMGGEERGEVNERPTHLDLFSGIGGFAIAAEEAGFSTVAFVERDGYCQRRIAERWPGVPIFRDVTAFRASSFRGVDLLTGGFPCQPFSHAGEQRGAEDDRYLWPDMLRIVQESQPDWVLGENVAGLDGLGLDDCISELEAGGYEVAPPLEIPACGVGAYQERNRIWIIANRTGLPVEKSEMVLQARSILESRKPAIGLSGCLWVPDPKTYLSDMVGDVHGVSNWLDRSKALGNAIVPQVAYEILKPIYDLITTTPHEH